MSDPPRESPPPTPRWVKVSAIIVLVLFLAVVVVVVLLGGHTSPVQHGP